MKKILITGGAGFIGLHLIKNLLKKKNFKIDIIDNFQRGKFDKEFERISKIHRVKLIRSDLNKKKIFSKDYAYIFHLSAILGVENVIKNPYLTLKQNISLTNKILDVCLKQKNLKKFIFFSTSEVYAGTLKHYGLKFPTPEKTPLTIESLDTARPSYMASKILGEMLTLTLKYKFPILIIRPHNFYGPRMGNSHVIPQLYKKIVKAKPDQKLLIKNSHHIRTFCYIDDAINHTLNLTFSKKSNNNIFNIGTKSEITIKKLAELIKKYAKRDDVKLSFNKIDSDQSPIRRSPSITKLLKISSIKNTSLNKGLAQTIKWYKKFS